MSRIIDEIKRRITLFKYYAQIDTLITEMKCLQVKIRILELKQIVMEQNNENQGA